jgi:hypothetical protein
MAAKRARTQIVNLKLRIRESERVRLAAAAKHNDVSLNSEIGRRIVESLDTAPIVGALRTTIDILNERLGALGELVNELRKENEKLRAAYIERLEVNNER